MSEKGSAAAARIKERVDAKCMELKSKLGLTTVDCYLFDLAPMHRLRDYDIYKLKISEPASRQAQSIMEAIKSAPKTEFTDLTPDQVTAIWNIVKPKLGFTKLGDDDWSAIRDINRHPDNDSYIPGMPRSARWAYTKSLTQHLKDPSSPVRRFLEERFFILTSLTRGSLFYEDIQRILGLRCSSQTTLSGWLD
ncbi:MAG: hypothetical protein M1305_05630 [Candidatus Marsarchaeota archaeon]|nr:hypothetical protein [Candidatus Marsarchaeota archaeon]